MKTVTGRLGGWLGLFLVCLGLGLPARALAQEAAGGTAEPAAALRKQAEKLMGDGNFKEAQALFARLALEPRAVPELAPADLEKAVACQRRLGNEKETDALVEQVVAVHAGNWRLLVRAARLYGDGNHNGFLVAGAFERGGHRGGTAKPVNAGERDRVRALQLLEQALRLAEADRQAPAGGYEELYESLCWQLLGGRGYQGAWKLQVLTDLSTLPDYEDGFRYDGNDGRRGAPVTAAGTPVLHALPQSWADAKSDGERWRWALSRRTGPAPKYEFAQFLQSQFGVATLAEYNWFFRGQDAGDDETRQDESGTWELHTLRENETIAKLATGIKRFTLPPEFDFLRLYRELARQDRGYRDEAWGALAEEFENRRQYDAAAQCWEALRQATRDSGQRDRAQRQLDQIRKNWGQFEPVLTQPAGGKGATVEFRFRNAPSARFEAVELDVATLLADVKAYLASNPRQLEWERLDLANIGWRIVEKDQGKYRRGTVAAWELALAPRPGHWDRRITVQTPLRKAGAYLLTATLPDGNVSRIVLWLADTAIVHKPLAGNNLYFVANAVTGAPVPGARLDFFGWAQRWRPNAVGHGGRHEIHTASQAGETDRDGLFTTELQVGNPPKGLDSGSYQWLVTATTADGRLAFLGFQNVWWQTRAERYDREYRQEKVFVMTDRPVYRPEQVVKFKVWADRAQYDKEGASVYANQESRVVIRNPRNEKVYEKTLLTDGHGGCEGELALPKDAVLGVWRIEFRGVGGGTFRVEEYKKPEFEVTVAAPTAPVMLGEAVTATVKAKYYFGAPVAEGKVKYKVLRTPHAARWFPWRWWDWFYGPGYWWFAADTPWYPGWREWGTARPARGWWPGFWSPPVPPEIVAEGEAPIGKDGLFPIRFDTAPAKLMHGDQDHKYEITAEVTDASRRTIVGTGTVLVARKPFKVYAWADRGHYRTGDVVQASFKALTLDRQPVAGRGELRLLRLRHVAGQPPVEETVERWNVALDAQGEARQPIKAVQAGQYRLSLRIRDAQGHEIEGGHLFCIMGETAAAESFRFNDIELAADRAEYRPGETVQLRVNTERADSTVLLFVRPANGVYLPPQVLRLAGKSAAAAVEVTKKDMPNFFVEAVTVSGGKLYSDVREIAVPPESRVLNVAATLSKDAYRPGEKARLTVKLTDLEGRPFVGTTALTVYDKSVEYIAGGSNVPEIKQFFWKWRRTHQPRGEGSLGRGSGNLLKSNEIPMAWLGVFGFSLADEEGLAGLATGAGAPGRGGGFFRGEARVMKRMSLAAPMAEALAAPAAPMALAEDAAKADAGEPGGGGAAEDAALVQPSVRSEFADTALWVGTLDTDANGEATAELAMPENLTTWKARVWAMGEGCRVGEGTAEAVTTKDLIVRLQAPRFFVQKDEVTLSANIHNYLKSKKKVTARLEIIELDGAQTTALDAKIERAKPDRWRHDQAVTVAAGGEQRVDWRVRIGQPGRITVRMSALTDEESDAMELTFPVYVHGMLKTESFSGVLRRDADSARIELAVPRERRPEQTRLELRYSPTLAGAMVDALPYLVDYPYGCTEQTLNRFLPTVVTQHTLKRLGLDLKAIQEKRTNLNAQEIGDDAKRAADWRRNNPPNPGAERNPVFDEAAVAEMVKAGIERLQSMQCADGGWGWFSGWGERSYPHTTAVVVHGLQLARDCGAAVPEGMLRRGEEWLRACQAEQLRRLKLPKGHKEHKLQADDLDALLYLVLVDAKADSPAMREFLYRDRNGLSVYAKAMTALACHRVGDPGKRDLLRRNVEQYLVQDAENQSAHLKLPEGTWWWCWHGSDIEAMAWYLKLLAAVEPTGDKAAGIVKYLANNRRHATYWNSTRDTAYVIEAFAEFLQGSGEEAPELTVAVLVDGREAKRVAITKANLFSFDNKLVLEGAGVAAGAHTVELRRVAGRGPLYFNAYLTNFTLEDPIAKAGLEVKIERKLYKLVPVAKGIKAEGVRGQALDQKVEKYERRELKDLAELKSGDLLEVELVVESKNDYEYIILEDLKAAGTEPVEVRSGYTGNEMGAYVEFRDERVAFFVRALARGRHSLSYRLRAEIPGSFSALPAKASAMYAPELKANSAEAKLKIVD